MYIREAFFHRQRLNSVEFSIQAIHKTQDPDKLKSCRLGPGETYLFINAIKEVTHGFISHTAFPHLSLNPVVVD